MNRRLFSLIAVFLSALALLLVSGAAVISMPEKTAEAVVSSVSVLPEGLGDLFTDYTRTELSGKYADEAALEELRSEYGDREDCKPFIDRAEKVLRGEVRFDANREFSTEDGAANPIEQYGDTDYYSDSVLKWGYASSDLQITGIYGIYQTEFTVYVEADKSARIPQIAITDHHAEYNNYRKNLQLSRGANTFSYTDFGTGSGGAIYIVNDYTEASQNGEVSLYIEGGDFYPVFEKDGDVTAFLGRLEEYEAKRSINRGIPDLAELVTDFAFFTTTSSSLYDTYITYKTIDPQENLELWGDLFTSIYEFNGIPTSEESPFGANYDPRNRGVRINFRYMKQYQVSGAYATAHHIGFYNEHYWFANFYNNSDCVGNNTTIDYSLYAMGHEIGHMLDTDGRRMAETTNNMSATYTYLKIMDKNVNPTYQPYEKTLKKLERDSEIDHLAYDDGKILYQTGNYDHNYMIWWYLESCFPGYWAKLNDMYRYDARSAPSNSNERMVYYSSLVTGVDLGNYFERWGLYLQNRYNLFTVSGASQTYKELMKAAEDRGEISDKFARFYYADDAEYGYILSHPESTEYTGEIPAIAVQSKDGKRTVTISGRQDPAHLGYEVRVSTDGTNYSTAGFTRTVQFTDDYDYKGAEPFYKVVAVNRYFNISGESQAAQAGAPRPAKGVCRVGDNYFNTLEEGISSAGSGGTVYLSDDCSIGEKQAGVTLEPDAGVKNPIRITVSGNSYMLLQSGNLTVRGRADARIIIDGGAIPRTYPPIYCSSGTFTAEYVDFVNHSASMGGGAFMDIGANIVLRHCTFANCMGKEASVISPASNHTVTLDDCEFNCDGTHILLKSGSSLIFENNISALTLGIEENAAVRAEGFTPADPDLKKIYAGEGVHARYNADDGSITFEPTLYTLTFSAEGREYTFGTAGSFVFGQENIPLGERYIYEYRETGSGAVYRAGDKLNVTEDKRFDCTLKNNVTVSLLYMDKTETLSVRGYERVYLPYADGNKKIVAWTAESGTIYPAGASAPATEEVFTPVYEGYLRYELIVRGNIKKSGYAKYGNTISLPALSDVNFKGWISDGKLFEGSARLVRDSLFIAAFEGETDAFDLSEAEVTFSEECIYDGTQKRPAFEVKVNGVEIPERYYSFSYSHNVEAGEGILELRGKGLAFNTCTATFTIAPRNLDTGNVSIRYTEKNVYMGSEIKPVPTVVYNGKTIGENDYTLEYLGDLVNVGRPEISINFRNNFAGVIKVYYEIVKAERPDPPTEVYAGNAATLGEIELPENWEWENGTLPVEGETSMKARAVYVGADADNYNNVTAEVTVNLPRQNENSSGCVDPAQPDQSSGLTDPSDNSENNDQSASRPDESQQTGSEPEQPEQPSKFNPLWYIGLAALPVSAAAVAAFVAFKRKK